MFTVVVIVGLWLCCVVLLWFLHRSGREHRALVERHESLNDQLRSTRAELQESRQKCSSLASQAHALRFQLYGLALPLENALVLADHVLEPGSFDSLRFAYHQNVDIQEFDATIDLGIRDIQVETEYGEFVKYGGTCLVFVPKDNRSGRKPSPRHILRASLLGFGAKVFADAVLAECRKRFPEG